MVIYKKVGVFINWMVTIDISNKAVYSLIAIVLVLGIGGIAYAYDGNSPSVMGHSAGELDGVCLSDGTNCPSLGGWTHSGEVVYDGTAVATAWNDLDLSDHVGSRNSLVLLKVDLGAGQNYESVVFRRGGEESAVGYTGVDPTAFGAGVSGGQSYTGSIIYVIVETDDRGVVEFKPIISQSVKVYLEGYL